VLKDWREILPPPLFFGGYGKSLLPPTVSTQQTISFDSVMSFPYFCALSLSNYLRNYKSGSRLTSRSAFHRQEFGRKGGTMTL